jgi:monoterpene epsilon-lactone hydrolase
MVRPTRSSLSRKLAPVLGPLAPLLRRRHSLARQRVDFDKGLPVPADISLRSALVGGVPAEWATPPEAGAGVVLYLHGGGYLIGSIVSHRELGSRIGRVARARVLLLGYRLAPEHPFPAAVDDAVAAYRALLTGGISPGCIAFVGDSAGGGLALATLLALRAAGDPPPAAAATLSAWTDLALTGPSLSRLTHDPYLTREGLEVAARAYLAGADPRHPLASPLYGAFAGLPPLLLQVSADEILVDDSRRVAAKARAAGVEVVLDEVPGLAHVFQRFPGSDPVIRRAVGRIGAFLLARWREGETSGREGASRDHS